MGRFSSGDIHAALDEGTINIYPAPVGSDVQPASVELHLHNEVIADPTSDEPIVFDINEHPCDGEYALMPDEFLLVSTTEHVALSNEVVGEVWGKSSLGRIGLLVHVTAGYIDPGFSGRITLELKNLSNNVIRLKPGMKIAQIAFDRLESPAPVAYGDPSLGSHYQGQTTTTRARFDA